jgi:Leucine-rich repeat (LRR) protein
MIFPGKKTLAPKSDDSLVQLKHAGKELEKEKVEMDEAGQVRPSGASIVQDETSPDRVCKLSGKMSDSQFQREIAPYKNMRAFCLENLTISLASSNYIFHLPIENLALIDMAISERQLDDLSKLQSLKRIRFFSCGDLPAGSIEKFKRLKLKSLDFEPGSTYENFGRAVTKLDSLESVTIRNGRIRRKDLEELLARLQIKMLNFDSCSIDSDAFTKLSSANQCTFFSCVNTRLTDKAFEQISELPSLIVLNLTGTNLNDRHLKMLHKRKGLRALCAVDTQVSQTGLEYLRSVVPGLKIMIQRPAQDEPF